MGKQLIEGGMADCVMALGFEKMERGSLKAKVRIKVHIIFNQRDRHRTAEKHAEGGRLRDEKQCFLKFKRRLTLLLQTMSPVALRDMYMYMDCFVLKADLATSFVMT